MKVLSISGWILFVAVIFPFVLSSTFAIVFLRYTLSASVSSSSLLRMISDRNSVLLYKSSVFELSKSAGIAKGSNWIEITAS